MFFLFLLVTPCISFLFVVFIVKALEKVRHFVIVLIHWLGRNLMSVLYNIRILLLNSFCEIKKVFPRNLCASSFLFSLAWSY